MQTPKSRPVSLDVPQRPSPRKLKNPLSNSGSVSSPNPMSKTPKERSPKVVDRRLSRSPANEKKRSNKMFESEPHLSRLQEELKKAKDQLNSSESLKKRAQQETEEAKKQLVAMSIKLEETRKQLTELSDSEESRVQELRKISQDRDRAWQSELEAVQNQHSTDSAALSSAMNEIQRINNQMDRVLESEASHASHAESAHAEIHSLRVELTETLDLVEKLKTQLNNSREFEDRALEEATRARMELDVLKSTEEALKAERASVVESYESLVLELEESKSRVNSLEELVGKIQGEKDGEINEENGEFDESEALKREVDRLRIALEEAENRYRNEYLQSTLQIRDAYEMVERVKSESTLRETELEAEVKASMAEAQELKAKLIEKENTLNNISLKVEENRQSEREMELEIELKKSESLFENLNLSLSEKEARLKIVAEENEALKSEIERIEMEKTRANDKALELARNSEREVLMKLRFLTEEADKSGRKTARINEQLDTAQAANSELEGELRRLKVQSDQWRKAAEAAAAMLSTDNNSNNNGKFFDRTGSMDYNHTIGGKLDASYSDDESPKKKNGNVLKKIGLLLKKGQK